MTMNDPWVKSAEKYWKRAKHDLCVEHCESWTWGPYLIVSENSPLNKLTTEAIMAGMVEEAKSSFNSLNSVKEKDVITTTRHKEMETLLARALNSVNIDKPMEMSIFAVYSFLGSLKLVERRFYYKRFKNNYIDPEVFMQFPGSSYSLAAVRYFSQTYVLMYETFYNELFKD